MTYREIEEKVNLAAGYIGKTWPLYSFVTGNQFSGYEDRPFFDALEQGGNLWGARVLPDAGVFRKAWEGGKIGSGEIRKLLMESGRNELPEYYLDQMETTPLKEEINVNHELDMLTEKWISLFMDEGMAAWQMPFKDRGFYTAWSILVDYDEEINKKLGGPVPKTPEEAITRILCNFDEKEHIEIFKRHLAALPGWAGFIKYRVENNSIWNREYPIDLVEFLAVRLWMARCLQVPILPPLAQKKNRDLLELKYVWLKAWELTWQNGFFGKLSDSMEQPAKERTDRPDAQLAFCLDSRSEVLRRMLEKTGNYETYGSAGAFGMPINYRHPESGLINKSSPAMLPSRYLVHEEVAQGAEKEVVQYKEKGKRMGAYRYFLGRLKNILPSAFGYVEGSGLYYGIVMLLRLFRPNVSERMMLHHDRGYEEIYEPHICSIEPHDSSDEIPIDEKASLVKGVFDSCGWTVFAPLIVITGHASHSANNPYASSLDCGACAGNPGKRNARTLVRLANTKEVREMLSKKYQIDIPDDTVFIAGEHITSSDEVRLFDAPVNEKQRKILNRLKSDLLEIRREMTRERLNEPRDAASLAKIKSNNWSETRPEYGLSGHAGYVIGPRSLTINGKFSDCFLSSYDWQVDEDGSILKGIMQGPLLVCQWISDHYYFSTVDNDVFGAGSKITHNVTGKYGVMQGNGSDLKIGLPLQSLMSSDEMVFHNPIRLTTLIQAPERFVMDILEHDDKLKSLVENDWIYLFVMDPESGNKIRRCN